MMLYTRKSQVSFTHKPGVYMKKIDAGVTMSLGAGIGAAIGVSFDNIAMGVALGAAIGAILGGVMSLRNKNDKSNEK
jgi:uncharacterized membrane protein